ncbi:TRAP transporter large permease [Sedimentitalea todarodis]|uniref:TRAP transporter large permease protein n=1 Tax=Sedimentitalea todarodis TaxID=1631240 RepID=A0ABU3VEB6_9RHOB|nr:TRAP transporter large permease [Sedimentitalea todarodis]MDU9004512.1 TRAP transporter large permease [Sedimentitalea todarodis]
MGVWEIAAISFGGVFVLMMGGMPIALAMLLVGLSGIWINISERTAMGMIGQLPINATMSYELSVLPMFILMGVFVTRARMSEDLYRLCHGFVGHLRGGLAAATILACGGFSALSGSSLATAATMAKVAVPEMRRYGYSDGFAASAVAAGGTLGILIPPSVILVLYGIATGTDIGSLFIAGILPGVLAIVLYLAAIRITAQLDPTCAPAAPRIGWPERLRHLRSVGPILLLFLGIIGGLYKGVFTPTEAGGVGATGALAFALWRRSLSPGGLIASLVETVLTTASLFLVLIGALVFANFMNLIGLPGALADLINSLGLGPTAVILTIVAIYLLLGMFMESLSMILLTIPIFFPIVTQLGFDPVWFGIFAVMVTELSLITPPVGLNLFVIKSVIDDLSVGDMYRGVLPFVLADVVRILIIIAFPWLVMVLPEMAR